MSRTVTVFGSSQPLSGEEEYEAAYKLGRLLGESGFSVCTGGYQGIMDAVSKGASEFNVDVIGVTVDLFSAVPSKHLTSQIHCNSLFERIEKLIEIGDAYIILRGGTGTLVELSISWELMNKNLIQHKPIACHGEMWQKIIQPMEERIEYEKRETGLVQCFDSIEECFGYIKSKF
ncbi:MAG: LOG family protein [Chlorobi bacterium]|nr:LOG family protein [Chlorobiota bacterium]